MVDLKSPAVLVICPVHNMETIVSILFKSYSFSILFSKALKNSCGGRVGVKLRQLFLG